MATAVGDDGLVSDVQCFPYYDDDDGGGGMVVVVGSCRSHRC